MNVTAAEAWCSSVGGILPMIYSDEENDFYHELGNTWLVKYLDPSTSKWWASYTNWKTGAGSDGHAQLINVDPVTGTKWNGLWKMETVDAPVTCMVHRHRM